MLATAVLFTFYFFILSLFSIISHPVYYCGLLVVNSLICGLLCYSIFGFGWYALLLCLVYIGGVYILFVFVSVHGPNTSYVTYFNLEYLSILLLIFILLIAGSMVFFSALNSEFSSFLCNVTEGKSYITMCLTLIFGFLISSLVMSVKFNHYR